MRRWHSRGALAIACQPGRTTWKRFHISGHARFASSAKTGTSTGNKNINHQQYAIFQKTPKPDSDRIEEWAALLDGALPPHLRDSNVSPPLLTLAATDLAEILLAAQQNTSLTSKGFTTSKEFDLLYHLGFEQGRWRAVVWLIKKLVDRFPIKPNPDTSTLSYLALWNQVPPFSEPFGTDSRTKDDNESAELGTIASPVAVKNKQRPLQLELDNGHSTFKMIQAKSLDELTGYPKDNMLYRQDLAHDALGQIWRTLGAMTQACAGGSIRQEVLEIIAYLHHREIMPTSIYQYQPRMDKSAVQQPPLIPLLSSRIFTSLSDAAWRAQEKLVVEELKVSQSNDVPSEAFALAAPYRARIDGLSPEVWLELILWSCLHGGWVEQGACILHAVAQRGGPWRPLSWREYEKSLPPAGQMNSKDWDAWDYLFKTKAPSTMDPPVQSVPDVKHTVSAEVVNAYIDALASLPSHEQAPRGSRFRVVPKLYRLQEFLAKQNLGLTTGSWDALAIRVLENQGDVLEKAEKETFQIIRLSPGLGQGLKSANTQDLPAYVLDGGLAMQGLLNRALYGRLTAGQLEPALVVFRSMLARTDKDKQTSMASFMEGAKPLLRALHGDDDMFTSNVPGIDYPAFNLQIPTTTLALLLDLVTQAKEYEFGRWLLYSKDADGPVIRQDQYDDHFLIPALVRFATATQDTELFSTLRSSPNFHVYLVLDAQIDAMRWDAAAGIVQYSTKAKRKGKFVPEKPWSTNNLANLARVMLMQYPGSTAGRTESRENFQSAKNLFASMVRQVERGSTTYEVVKTQTLLNALASVDNFWAGFCFDLRRRIGHHDFQLNATQFNLLLEGVVTAYGSVGGRRLLRLLWPRSVRPSYRATSDHGPERVELQDRNDLQRIVVPGLSDEQKAVMYGALEPNARTIGIILRRALEELREQKSDGSAAASQTVVSHFSGARKEATEDDEEVVEMSQRGMIAWATRQLADLPRRFRRSDMISNLEVALVGLDMDDLREEIPGIVRSVEKELKIDDSTGEDDLDILSGEAAERKEESSGTNEDAR